MDILNLFLMLMILIFTDVIAAIASIHGYYQMMTTITALLLKKWKGSLTIYRDGRYANFGITSTASPVTAGVGALYLMTHPTATQSQVRTALQNAGSHAGDTCNGGARGYFTGDFDTSRELLLYVGGFWLTDWVIDWLKKQTNKTILFLIK
jgi:hypothetical protein